MKYHELNITAHRRSSRVGRGISAGQGKTAGRGTKGQKSRAGSSKNPGFEGGQSSLIEHLPKLRGFKSHKSQPENVYTGQLNDLGAVVDNHTLAEAGLTTSANVKVKLLKSTDVSKKMTVNLQSASASAIKNIAAKGGVFKAVPQVGRVKQTDNSKQK